MNKLQKFGLVKYQCSHPIQCYCSYVVEGVSGLSQEEVQELALEQHLQNFEVDEPDTEDAVQNLFLLGSVEQLSPRQIQTAVGEK